MILGLTKISVCIPIHSMMNADFFLRRNLDILSIQKHNSFNIEIIITDNSDDDHLKEICKEYSDLDLKYSKNPRKGMAQNTNEAIKRATGSLIKILYLDDYLSSENSLYDIIDAFMTRPEANWLATGCEHGGFTSKRFSPHIPKFSAEDSDNFIGSPSVITIKNNLDIYFDESLTWLLDFDFYRRLNKYHGKPILLDNLNVVIGIGKHQMTNILSDELKLKEKEYIINKII